MTFRALLTTPVFADPKKPVDTTLEFTKTRIKFPDTLSENPFQDGDIKNNAIYELKISDDLDKRMKYSIVLSSGKRIFLIVDKPNERKLKWIHHLYWFQKEPLAVISLVIAILSLIATIIF